MRITVRREAAALGCPAPRLRRTRRYRYAARGTETSTGQLAHFDARHRAHARIEDRIRCAKDTGLIWFSTRSFAINVMWLTWYC